MPNANPQTPPAASSPAPITPATPPANPAATPMPPAPPPESAPEPPASSGQPGPAAPAPDEGVHDVLLATILNSLRPEAASPADVEPAIEPAAELSAEPPAESAAAPAAEPPPVPAVQVAAAAPPVPPVSPAAKKKTIRSVAKGHPAVEPPPVPPAPAPPVEPPAAPSGIAAGENLPEEQQDELAEAVVAERLFGSRYQGHSAALKKWYADFDGRAAALRARNPDLTEQDDEYQALLATKPALKPADYKRVAKTMATEAAVAETSQRLAPKLDKLEMDARRAEVLPGVQDFTQRVFGQGVRQLIQADAGSCLHEPMKLALEKGLEAALAEFPEEATVMRETMDAQKRRVHEFLLLKHRAAAFDPRNQTHQEIAQLINEEGRGLVDYGAKNGPQHLLKDGRQFLPRDEFIALLGSEPAEARTFNPAQWTTRRYWTFTDAAIVDIMAIRAKREAESRITFERERAGRLGYVKAPRKSVAESQPATPPAALAPPKATPSATPGLPRPVKPASVDHSPIPVASVAARLKITK